MVYTGRLPWVVYSLVYPGGIYALVHPPGYTSHASRPPTGTRWTTLRDGLTALTRALAERTVADGGVTIRASPVSLLVVRKEERMRRRVLLFLLGREERMLRRVSSRHPPVSLLG